MQYSYRASVFHGRKVPESEATIVGYSALIHALSLSIPIPNVISIISSKNRKYQIDGWQVFTPRYNPENSLYKQLVFALKYEGVNLLFFKKLFDKLTEQEVVALITDEESTGIYSRKIWFLYEWLLQKELPLTNADVKIKYTPLLDDKIQYAITGTESARHRIINNLPGTVNYCPLIYKTEKLQQYIESDMRKQKNTILDNIQNDVLQRASAYLLLKDSKASFSIEGEEPRNNRASRWGNAIGQAGINDLTLEELIRLQQIVIESKRFTKMGIRQQEGFIGDRDRLTKEPIPDHISAKHEDLEVLIDGLIQTQDKLIESEIDPVLASSILAFGFVFIHPFVDGNGRLHRYIIHHLLAKMNYTQQGMIFPVSASILSHIKDYNKVLEAHSHPILEFIEWKSANDYNVSILNDTIDYYRYFDVTKQTEFLYSCVQDTILNIIPQEVDYLARYDEFKNYIEETYEMPDDLILLLVRFLEQGNGELSNRALKKEFSALSKKERKDVEDHYHDIFLIE